ncbi:PIN domain-containing protein [Candidatus Woesearchaeota archaeon]|nr:PIN domain-containing protein [Candidatus Woesearchaeota archaeon]
MKQKKAGVMTRYFFDTYALVEIIKNNPNYIKYFEEIITTSKFNLAELYFSLLRDLGEEKAKDGYSQFKDCAIELKDEIIFEAMKLKLQLKKKNLSYTDCIGYIWALKNNLRFLTGDKEFKDMANVEFAQ